MGKPVGGGSSLTFCPPSSARRSYTAYKSKETRRALTTDDTNTALGAKMLFLRVNTVRTCDFGADFCRVTALKTPFSTVPHVDTENGENANLHFGQSF